MLASWWDTLKSIRPIDCLILSNEKSLLEEMYGLMRILMESNCWRPPLNCWRMIPLMFYSTLSLLFHFSIPQMDNQTLFMSQLDYQTLIWLVCRYFFRMVCHLHRLKLFQLLINLLQWTKNHLFLVYLDGIPRQLKLLDLISVTFPLDEKIEFKISMLALHWWIVFLKFMILFRTRILKDDLNGNKLCRKKWFFVEESLLGLSSMIARKECCEVSMGLQEWIYLWRYCWTT